MSPALPQISRPLPGPALRAVTATGFFQLPSPTQQLSA